ncbi:PhoX family protein [Actinomycetospora aeridis]|uniref:PhoX family phosphatase n=1 Tax=Actinomycetospora aeridis TaxID=3129231 RepID=A0ABU8N0P6_9PSEU
MRLLPLAVRRPHGRPAVSCRYRCADACSREAPNPTGHTPFREVAAAALSRRRVLQAGLVAGISGTLAAACGTGGGAAGDATPAAQSGAPMPSPFGFTAVAPNTEDVVRIPEGFAQQVVIRWGDPVLPGAPAFDANAQSAAAQAQQFGFNNDFLALLDVPGSPGRALLVANHEYTTEPFMIPGYNPDAPTPEQVAIGMAAHGMSVVMVQRDGASGRLTPVMDAVNRRITASTPMTLVGPVAGDALVRTTADPEGRTVLGTLNNCAGGVTPWRTVLTGEENIDQYFANGETVGDPKLARYGMDGGATERKWEGVDPRFDLTREPNEANRFGWIVELDPFDPTSTPRKHTALGRFKHEGANVRVGPTGTVAVYMGDDERFEYLYKFVSSRTHRAGDTPADRESNARLLDEGTLFVARFSPDAPGGGPDGSGEWLPLVESLADGTGRSFVPGMTAAQVLVHTRIAADTVAPTPMDRPEDVQPHPTTGRVYAALTNNDERGTPGKPGADGVNPRNGNTNGQVLELTEGADDPGARTFAWSLLLVCGDPAAADTYFGGFPKDQVSPISCPDNVAFDAVGNLWIATDGNALGSNDGLFAVPLDGPQRGRVQQFLTVPRGAETCGPVVEERLALVSVQHPGEADDASLANPVSHWPDGGTSIARPAVVSVWRADGGPLVAPEVR